MSARRAATDDRGNDGPATAATSASSSSTASGATDGREDVSFTVMAIVVAAIDTAIDDDAGAVRFESLASLVVTVDNCSESVSLLIFVAISSSAAS